MDRFLTQLAQVLELFVVADRIAFPHRARESISAARAVP
jgi:hypothetical protein